VRGKRRGGGGGGGGIGREGNWEEGTAGTAFSNPTKSTGKEKGLVWLLWGRLLRLVDKRAKWRWSEGGQPSWGRENADKEINLVAQSGVGKEKVGYECATGLGGAGPAEIRQTGHTIVVDQNISQQRISGREEISTR